jgi:hypothetical protein
LIREVCAAAGSLAVLTTDALTWAKVPHFDGELFFRAACQRWLDVATSLTTTGAESTFTPEDFDQAAQDLVTGRSELLRAVEALMRAAGRGTRPSTVADEDGREV